MLREVFLFDLLILKMTVDLFSMKQTPSNNGKHKITPRRIRGKVFRCSSSYSGGQNSFNESKLRISLTPYKKCGCGIKCRCSKRKSNHARQNFWPRLYKPVQYTYTLHDHYLGSTYRTYLTHNLTFNLHYITTHRNTRGPECKLTKLHTQTSNT